MQELNKFSDNTISGKTDVLRGCRIFAWVMFLHPSVFSSYLDSQDRPFPTQQSEMEQNVGMRAA